MKNYLYNMNYGNMDFDSTNVDMFWLEGNSKINQFQQIGFLRTFNEQRLPISTRTLASMGRMMVIEANEHFTFRGKTGWSVTDDKDNCWFVGFVETNRGFYYFATNIEPTEQTDLDSLSSIRKNITIEALRKLGALN